MTATQWLVGYIDQAFRNVRLGVGTDIYAAESLDWYGKWEEGVLSERAERIDWRRVPPQHLVARPSALSFLDPQGFRFYLPAIMTIITRREDQSGMLTESFLYRLADAARDCTIRDAPYRTLLNRSQRATVIRFLQHQLNRRQPYGRREGLCATLGGLRRCAHVAQR